MPVNINCRFHTPSQLAIVLAAGHTIRSGPHLTEEGCITVCVDTGTGTGTNLETGTGTAFSTGTGSDDTYYWYCIAAPTDTGTGTDFYGDVETGTSAGNNYQCLFANLLTLQLLIDAGWVFGGGPYTTMEECEEICNGTAATGTSNTGTGTGTGTDTSTGTGSLVLSSIDVEFIDVADMDCSACAELNGVHNLPGGLDTFESAPVAWICGIEGELDPIGHYVLDLEYNGSVIILHIRNLSGNADFAEWTVAIADWDHSTPQVLDLGGGSGTLCTWPATVTVTPVWT